MITIKIFFIIILLNTFLHATENFSEMSTQELISIVGYVKKADKEKFKTEINSRIPFMSDEEMKKYKQNMKKVKRD